MTCRKVIISAPVRSDMRWRNVCALKSVSAMSRIVCVDVSVLTYPRARNLENVGRRHHGVCVLPRILVSRSEKQEYGSYAMHCNVAMREEETRFCEV